MRARLLPAVAALAIFAVAATWVARSALPPRLAAMQRRGALAHVATDLDDDKLGGTAIQQLAVDDSGTVLVFGSSELRSTNPFAPARILTKERAGIDPFLVGRPGSQSLILALDAAALGPHAGGKPVVIMVSPQWFGNGGLREYYFAHNWSLFKAYSVLESTSMPEPLRQRLAHRLLAFRELRSDPVLWVSLAGAAHGGPLGGLLRAVAWPLERFEVWALGLQDEFDAYGLLLRNDAPPPPPERVAQPLDWGRLHADAESVSASATAGNELGVDEGYWEWFKPRAASFRGHESGDSYHRSTEWTDLALLFDVLRAEQVRPLVVIQPVNGPWYDYMGLARAERGYAYRNVRRMAEARGFAVLDLSGHEYERGFMEDPAHLGWKGWVAVDEAMARFAARSDGR